MKPRFSSASSARRNRLFSIAAALCAGHSLQAVQVTWQGNADTNLGNALNWVGGVAPVSNTDGVLFDVAGSAGSSLVQNSNIQYTNVGGAITFSANAPAYTISGTGEITLGTGHIVNNSPNPQTINSNLRRNTSNSLTIGASGATLAMNGQYDIRAANLNTVAFGTTSGGNVMFNGNLVNTGAAGTYGVTVSGSGSGTLTLAGNNTVLNGNLTLDDNITVKLASPTAWVGTTAVAGNNSNTAVWLASDAALGTFTLDCSAATAARAHNVILGTASGAAVTNQTLSTITIGQQQGVNFLKAGNVTSGTPALSVSGTTTSLTVTAATVNTGSNLDFDIGSGTTFQNTAIAAPAFISPYATVGGNEFARYDASGFVVAALDGNYTGVVQVAAGGSTSGYYRLDGPLTRDPVLDWAFKGIRLTNTGDSDSLDLNGGTLTFSNSAIIYKGGSDNNYSISNGTLRSNATNVQFNVVSGATLTLNADIANNPGASTVACWSASCAPMERRFPAPAPASRAAPSPTPRYSKTRAPTRTGNAWSSSAPEPPRRISGSCSSRSGHGLHRKRSNGFYRSPDRHLLVRTAHRDDRRTKRHYE